MEDVWLNDVWALYFHDPYDNNWDRESYIKLFTFSNINEFWMMYTVINNILNEGMFFIMRDYIFPKWNELENKDGGFLSIKILKEKVPSFCEDILINLINETILLSDFYDKSDLINGISISPKKHFCIIKIWLRNCELSDISKFNIKNEYYGDILFKPNTCMM